ncbi:hypothetical protein FTX61_16105 [Nitriliruptoraceae bacterium ZYF776]|nr:hypothetical protein [Profundirhabdus halotolerans]
MLGAGAQPDDLGRELAPGGRIGGDGGAEEHLDRVAGEGHRVDELALDGSCLGWDLDADEAAEHGVVLLDPAGAVRLDGGRVVRAPQLEEPGGDPQPLRVGGGPDGIGIDDQRGDRGRDDVHAGRAVGGGGDAPDEDADEQREGRGDGDRHEVAAHGDAQVERLAAPTEHRGSVTFRLVRRFDAEVAHDAARRRRRVRSMSQAARIDSS